MNLDGCTSAPIYNILSKSILHGSKITLNNYEKGSTLSIQESFNI